MRNIVKSARIAVSGLVTLSLFVPTLAHADTLDAQMDCKSDGHSFISPLLVSGEIEVKPMRVEPNSINAFRVKKGVHLTAFDYRVYAVIGYQKDDPLFQVGNGQPIADSAYGVIVIGPTEDVEDRVHQAGGTAVVHRVNPLVTAIICQQ
jgi:hypothetical protein